MKILISNTPDCDSKRRIVEQKMMDTIQTAKSLRISKEELNAMMDWYLSAGTI